MSEQLREECAVAAVSQSDSDAAAALVYEQLLVLQHRGEEGTGIVSYKADGQMELQRSLNSVKNTYNADVLNRLAASVAIGHCLYSTSNAKVTRPHPFKDRDSGVAFAHNGTVAVTEELDNYLIKHNLPPKNVNDSQKMFMALNQEVRLGNDLPTAIERLNPLFKGAYSCVAMHQDMLVAFRDPNGIRPLSLGQIDNDYFVASETCGLDSIDVVDNVRDIDPGEMVIIQNGKLESRRFADPDPKLDMFEIVYFARPDSKMLGKSLFEYRYDFGQRLALEHPPNIDDHDNIVVVPVPDTSIPTAEGYTDALKLTKSTAIIKNRGSSRTFMLPSNALRHKQLRRKHNIIPARVFDKDVMLIDDSIVRGNTVPRLVEVLKSVGARSVNVLIGSPPVRFSDYYGIDTPTQKELMAAQMTVESMRKQFGCDYLGFLSLKGMVEATGFPASRFNLSCFNGEYPIDIGDNKHDIQAPVSMQFAD